MYRKTIFVLTLIIALALLPFNSVFALDTTEFEDIEPYTGSIPYGHILYPLKLMFEDIDEALTFDPIRKMEKRLNHAELRLSEAKREMLLNHTTNRLMLNYRNKLTDVAIQLVRLNDTDMVGESQLGLKNAQLRIEHHRQVLQKMSDDNPENRGLMVAVQNTNQLRERFEQKIGKK